MKDGDVVDETCDSVMLRMDDDNKSETHELVLNSTLDDCKRIQQPIGKKMNQRLLELHADQC